MSILPCSSHGRKAGVGYLIQLGFKPNTIPKANHEDGEDDEKRKCCLFNPRNSDGVTSAAFSPLLCPASFFPLLEPDSCKAVAQTANSTGIFASLPSLSPIPAGQSAIGVHPHVPCDTAPRTPAQRSQDDERRPEGDVARSVAALLSPRGEHELNPMRHTQHDRTRRKREHATGDGWPSAGHHQRAPKNRHGDGEASSGD